MTLSLNSWEYPVAIFHSPFTLSLDRKTIMATNGYCLACDHIAKRLKTPLTPVAIGMRRFLFSQKS